MPPRVVGSVWPLAELRAPLTVAAEAFDRVAAGNRTDGPEMSNTAWIAGLLAKARDAVQSGDAEQAHLALSELRAVTRQPGAAVDQPGAAAGFEGASASEVKSAKAAWKAVIRAMRA